MIDTTHEITYTKLPMNASDIDRSRADSLQKSIHSAYFSALADGKPRILRIGDGRYFINTVRDTASELKWAETENERLLKVESKGEVYTIHWETP